MTVKWWARLSVFTSSRAENILSRRCGQSAFREFQCYPIIPCLRPLPRISIRHKVEMAPEQKKRPRPVPNASQRSKKRQKIEPAKVAKPLEKRRVAVDALPWNEVEMPQMFDDAEGFYGLEEVEGVEIIRGGGTVQFVRSLRERLD